MTKNTFLNRMKNSDLFALLTDIDSKIAILIFFIIGFHTDWNISYESTLQILDTFLLILAFFIPLLFLVIVLFLSFFDKEFVLWMDSQNDFVYLITTLQFNFYIQLIILTLLLFIKFVYFNPILTIFTIALFSYELLAMFSFVKHTADYAIDRFDYLKIQ